jgi:hypothetical protein
MISTTSKAFGAGRGKAGRLRTRLNRMVLRLLMAKDLLFNSGLREGL